MLWEGGFTNAPIDRRPRPFRGLMTANGPPRHDFGRMQVHPAPAASGGGVGQAPPKR